MSLGCFDNGSTFYVNILYTQGGSNQEELGIRLFH